MANQTEIITRSYEIIQSALSGVITDIIISLIILFVGMILGRIVGRFTQKGLHELELNKLLKAARISINLEDLISKFLTYFIYFVAIIMALKNLGIATDILNIFAIAVMVIIVISIFLGIKDFIPNALSGITIYRKEFLKKGDTIKVKGLQGTITEITLVETKIETKGKDIISIPNSTLTKNEVTKVRKKR